MPTHSHPRCTAESTAPRMTALSPGASPPPVEMAIFTSTQGLLDQPQDLARLRMAAERLLGNHPALVDFDFEHPARGLDQLHLGVGVGFANLGRQTGGPRFVVSDDAVLDRDVHA